MPRYRIEYAKTDSARFLSHLELVRVFNRALRRSGLPLVFTQGFSPHPKVSFSPSLGVGVAGRREYLDVDLALSCLPGAGGAVSHGARSPLLEHLSSLGRQFPSGLEIRSMLELPPGAPGIGKAVNCAWYRWPLPPDQDPAAWRQALDQLAENAPPLYYQRPRDGKLFDVASGLEACRITEAGCRKSDAGAVECGAAPGAGDEGASAPAGGDGLALDVLASLVPGAVPLRGLVETLLSLVETVGCFEPALVTRMALLWLNGGLINPLGERKQLWEF